jgi:hypothetical protein
VQDFDVPVGTGGRASATLTINIGGQPTTLSITFYVVGVQIPNSVITSRLLGYYTDGARPRLFVGLADRESGYMQFHSRSLYGQTALWPYESYDGGSHIGLLMVEPTLARAYSYWENTQYGRDFFLGPKMGLCGSYANSQMNQHPGLRYLTPLEFEMCALVKYGPNADLGYYWVPNEDGTDWIVDPNSAHAAAIAYANDVIGRMYNH